MANTRLLEEVIQNSGLKKSYISDKLGITRYGLLKKIKNESEFKASEIDKLSKILRIDNVEEIHKIFFDKQVDK